MHHLWKFVMRLRAPLVVFWVSACLTLAAGRSAADYCVNGCVNIVWQWTMELEGTDYGWWHDPLYSWHNTWASSVYYTTGSTDEFEVFWYESTVQRVCVDQVLVGTDREEAADGMVLTNTPDGHETMSLYCDPYSG